MNIVLRLVVQGKHIRTPYSVNVLLNMMRFKVSVTINVQVVRRDSQTIVVLLSVLPLKQEMLLIRYVNVLLARTTILVVHVIQNVLILEKEILKIIHVNVLLPRTTILVVHVIQNVQKNK